MIFESKLDDVFVDQTGLDNDSVDFLLPHVFKRRIKSLPGARHDRYNGHARSASSKFDLRKKTLGEEVGSVRQHRNTSRGGKNLADQFDALGGGFQDTL